MTTKKKPAKQPEKKAMPAKNKGGRPSKLTPELADELCRRIASGRSLNSVCKDPDMPSTSMAMRYAIAYDWFREKYERAVEARHETMADEILEISDDGSKDYVEKVGADGQTYEAVNTEHIQRSRLRVDARKWLLARLAPRKYGDRVQTEVSGPDGGAVPVELTVRFVRADDGRPA